MVEKRIRPVRLISRTMELQMVHELNKIVWGGVNATSALALVTAMYGESTLANMNKLVNTDEKVRRVKRYIKQLNGDMDMLNWSLRDFYKDGVVQGAAVGNFSGLVADFMKHMLGLDCDGNVYDSRYEIALIPKDLLKNIKKHKGLIFLRELFLEQAKEVDDYMKRNGIDPKPDTEIFGEDNDDK